MFGDILKGLRKSNKITQVQLASELNLDKSSIAKYESAGVIPSPDILKAIAKYFNVSIDYLLEQDDINKKNDLSDELNDRDKKDIARAMDKILKNLDNNSELMFDGEPLDEESKELFKISLENSLKMGKALAKKKYGRKNKKE